MKIQRKKQHFSDVLWRRPLCTWAYLRICHAVTTEKFSYLCVGFLAYRFSLNQICTACNLPPEPRAHTQLVERTQLWYNGWYYIGHVNLYRFSHTAVFCAQTQYWTFLETLPKFSKHVHVNTHLLTAFGVIPQGGTLSNSTKRPNYQNGKQLIAIFY